MAPAPGSRAVRPVLHAGDLLAGRYRLEHPVEPAPRAPTERESPAVLWRASDEVLARPVAVKVVRAAGARGAAAAAAFVEAAAAAGAVSGPVLARVYDADVQERPTQPLGRPAGDAELAYVISEWVDGQDLAAALREGGPFDPDAACALVAEVAEALEAAHQRGVVHGRIHPGNVLLLADGRLKVTDTATSAALPERAVPADRAGDPVGPAADVRDLTAVLYAMLTGRWPASATPQPSCGVPPAPTVPDGRDRGRLTSPRQVRAGVPRALDDLVVRVLRPTPGRPGPATAAGLADALAGSVRTDVLRPPPLRRPWVPEGLRRRLPVLAAVVLLVVVGSSAYVVGREVVDLPRGDGVVGVSPPPVSVPPPAAEPIDLSAAEVTDFDPPPGDGAERPASVPAAVDGDPGTAWQTERYRTSAFGGLKTGVGLLVDLGEPTALAAAEVLTLGGPTTVELRAADARGAAAEDYRVVARGTAQDDGVVLAPDEPTTARFYLIWITSLPESGSARIAELRFLRG